LNGNDFSRFTIDANLKARSETIKELSAILESGSENVVDQIIEPLFKTQNADAAIISVLLDAVGVESELRQAVEYWRVEAKKYEEAFTAFRFQNRV